MGDNGRIKPRRYTITCDDPRDLMMYTLKLGLKYAELQAGPDQTDKLAHAAWHYITEGRDGVNNGVRYGWCGDQITNVLFNGGVRSHWLNRDEMNGPGSWAPAMNIEWIERFVMEAGIIQRNPTLDDLRVGDIFVITNPGHIGMVIGVNTQSFDSLDGNGPGRISVCQSRVMASKRAVVGDAGDRVLYWRAPVAGLQPYVSAPQTPLNFIPPPETVSSLKTIRKVHPLAGDAATQL